MRKLARVLSLYGLGVIAAGLLAYALVLRALAALPPAQEALSLPARAAFAPTLIPAEAAAALVELNSATEDELSALPGIGAKTAAAIVAFRQEIGGFRYPEELLLINGIGEGRLNAIYDLIYVRQEEQ